MATTIQISDTTKQMLQYIKEKKHAASYEEVIVELVRKEAKVPASLFGAFTWPKWTKEDRPKDREL
ncbi:hypothetical protein J4207_06645 [Candidatus Woesearchaeota archaeon]|nr:hypothetical protein [Candidatus Woesearchaeota archaeon]